MLPKIEWSYLTPSVEILFKKRRKKNAFSSADAVMWSFSFAFNLKGFSKINFPLFQFVFNQNSSKKDKVGLIQDLWGKVGVFIVQGDKMRTTLKFGDMDGIGLFFLSDATCFFLLF